MSLASPVDYFLAIDEELRQLEYDVRRGDQIIQNFDDLQAAGMNLENPQRVRNILLREGEKSQTAMNNRVIILLRGNSSLETSR
jgi:hypothetical protein